MRIIHNEYPLAPDKTEIKREMSEYQLEIAYIYSIHFGNVKK